MTRRRQVAWLAVLCATAAAFLAGSRLAGSAPEKRKGVVADLLRREALLWKDLRKVEKAGKDILELREMRESGKYVLNREEKKLEKTARMDLHVYMERSRNDALEVLGVYERTLKTQEYVEPLRRKFGKALDEVVVVRWEDQDLESIVDELIDGYGVRVFIKGDLNYRKTISLNGEMSLGSILLQLENIFDAKLVLKDGNLWFVRATAAAKSDD